MGCAGNEWAITAKQILKTAQLVSDKIITEPYQDVSFYMPHWPKHLPS